MQVFFVTFSIYWVSLGGRVGHRMGSARKERPLISFAVSIHFSLSAWYCSFTDLCKNNSADLKKEMNRDPIFRNSRLAKMGSDNVTVAIACRTQAQKGQCFLCFSKQYPKGVPLKQILQFLTIFAFFQVLHSPWRLPTTDLWDKGLSNIFWPLKTSPTFS